MSRSIACDKVWVERQLERLAAWFGIDLLGFSVLSNHFHLILRSRPDAMALCDDIFAQGKPVPNSTAQQELRPPDFGSDWKFCMCTALCPPRMTYASRTGLVTHRIGNTHRLCGSVGDSLSRLWDLRSLGEFDSRDSLGYRIARNLHSPNLARFL